MLFRDTDMSVEGIFRKNGNIRRLKDLTDAIDRDPSSVDLTQDNAVQLAALLKKFLRELPEPLLTFKLHRLLVATQCTRIHLWPILRELIEPHSTSHRRRKAENASHGILVTAQVPQRHDGGTFRVPQVGRLLCPYG